MSQAIKCNQCGTDLNVTPPEVNAVNHPLFSQVIAFHPTGVTCAGCGGYYVAAIADAQFMWTWVAAERPKEASRIIPADGLSLASH